MVAHSEKRPWLGLAVSVCAAALGASGLAACGDSDSSDTASPIKHVIIVVGENRSFDHLFATYVPQHPEEGIHNLLSEQIVTASGAPGLLFSRAYQYRITSAPNGGNYFMSADLKDKALYATLPPPDVNSAPPVSPNIALLNLPGGDPELLPQDQFLFGTGGTGLSYTLGPDTRIADVFTLPPGPFQLTGPTMPFDAFTGDMSHLYFTMVQQADCAIDAEHVSGDNPTGCLHDLQTAVNTTYATPAGTVPHDTGQTMAFFNMQQGDAPVSKYLADMYTISDNYHQPVFGATWADSQALGFADQLYYSDGHGHPVTPDPSGNFNPDPQAGTLNLYRALGAWYDCSDEAQPGIGAIASYLRALPYAVSTNCSTGLYFSTFNVSPPFTPKGVRVAEVPFVLPPTTQPSIGDVLSAHRISWKYYGGGFNEVGTNSLLATFCQICNPFQYEANYPDIVPEHMRDVTDLFTDLANGTLPAVSYVKPDGYLDGHPGGGKWTLFEAFVKNLIQRAQSNPRQWAGTAIFITVDESGGYYDSGFIQWVDFFGTGPRIPLIAVSPYSTGGHVSHVYNEHSSFVKFIERNWKIQGTLSERSRDNLPNPIQDADNPYVPKNMPAIGDLFDMFQFP
ncbi:MAG TPA: alkaline phosphatase family protein [Steroidobacteraceae bacterium]